MRKLTLALFIMLLAACGQKGLLYIPDESSADSSQNREEKDSAPNDNDNEE